MKVIKTLFPFAFIAFLFIWGFLALNIDKSKDASPIDDYIKATNEAYYKNVQARADAQKFIDSINHK